MTVYALGQFYLLCNSMPRTTALNQRQCLDKDKKILTFQLSPPSLPMDLWRHLKIPAGK